eukprot:jgi/Botrbrau1/21766/Bobra.43_1s0156.1
MYITQGLAAFLSPPNPGFSLASPFNNQRKQTTIHRSRNLSRAAHLKSKAQIRDFDPATYMNSFTLGGAPKHLDLLLKILEAQGAELVPRWNPLICTLMSFPWRASPRTRFPGEGIPVVQTGEGQGGLRLLARTATEYVHRSVPHTLAYPPLLTPQHCVVFKCSERKTWLSCQLFDDDDDGDDDDDVLKHVAWLSSEFAIGFARFHMCEGRRGAGGEAAEKLLKAQSTYVIRRVGLFPDVIERLVGYHGRHNDELAALVTAEWYMRKEHFPGYAQPTEFNASYYANIHRPEEARDYARVALQMPWWTLQRGWEGMAGLAGLPACPTTLQEALQEEAALRRASSDRDAGPVDRVWVGAESRLCPRERGVVGPDPTGPC